MPPWPGTFGSAAYAASTNRRVEALICSDGETTVPVMWCRAPTRTQQTRTPRQTMVDTRQPHRGEPAPQRSADTLAQPPTALSRDSFRSTRQGKAAAPLASWTCESLTVDPRYVPVSIDHPQVGERTRRDPAISYGRPRRRFHHLNRPRRLRGSCWTLRNSPCRIGQVSAAPRSLSVYVDCHQSRRASAGCPALSDRSPAGKLTSDKSRVEAHRFYRRLGFVASHEGMKLALA
jgi:hypothetical protein